MGANLVASYNWTGGSYMRQLWLAFLIYGLAALHTKRYRWAGGWLTLSACMRIFPLVFVAGAGVALLGAAWRKQVTVRQVVEFTVAGLVVGAVMVGASLLMFEPSLWTDFFHKIQDHGDTYFVNHIGFKKWVTYGPRVPGQNFWWGEGLERFVGWNEMLHQNWERRRWLYEPIRLAMMGSAALLAWRAPPPRAALLLGGTVMFCMTIPANYYYVWLAIMPAMYVRSGASKSEIFRALLGLSTVLLMASLHWSHPDDLVRNFYWNRTMMGFFSLWVLAGLAELAPTAWASLRRPAHSPS